MNAFRRSGRDERGMAALELTILAPALLVILLFVVGLGRMAHARQQIEAVAADSARAASLQRDKASASAAATAAAHQSLGDAGVSCRDLTVRVYLAQFEPGGTLRVAVSCRASLGDIAVAGLPGSRVFTATSSVPIETYRER